MTQHPENQPAEAPTTADQSVSPSPAPIEEREIISGRISSATIPTFVQTLRINRETGVLAARDGNVKKSIYVQDGQLVFARSNDPQDLLANVLVRQGLVTIEQYEECEAEVIPRKRRLGRILLERGYISTDDLKEAVLAQVRDIIHSMFQWTRGDYQFHLGPLPTNETITLSVNTQEILRSGIQRITSWIRVREGIGGLEARYRTASNADELLELELPPDEYQILMVCADPPITVGEMCQVVPGNQFENCRSAWALAVIGALQRAI